MAAPPPEGGAGSGSGTTEAGLGPDPGRGGGGVPGAGGLPGPGADRPVGLTVWGTTPGASGEMSTDPREVGVRPSPPIGSVGGYGGKRPEVGGHGSPGASGAGPGPCGKEEWPPDCAAGHPSGLVLLGWEG